MQKMQGGVRIGRPVALAKRYRRIALSAATIGGLALLVWTVGCGPIGYLNQVTRKASASVAAAKASRAEVYSPYWYTLAIQYLHKAREEASYADFEAANRFGRKAQQAAVRAQAEALARAKDPSKQDWLPPPQLRGKSDPRLPPNTSGDDGLAPALPDDGGSSSKGQR